MGLEMIVESRHGGFEGFLAVVSHLQRSYRQVGGAAAGAAAGAGGGIFASKSPAEVIICPWRVCGGSAEFGMWSESLVPRAVVARARGSCSSASVLGRVDNFLHV